MKGLGKLSLSFAAGCVGGVLSALLMYLCGALGLMEFYGVKMAPALTSQWLYERTVWGGLWGLLFALPRLDKTNWLLAAILCSILPILAQLFIFYPLVNNEGLMGVKLGSNTIYFVVLFGLVWSFLTSFWLRLSRS